VSLRKSVKERPCKICEVNTSFVDVDLGYYICSPECDDDAWDKLHAAYDADYDTEEEYDSYF